ncbi:MAG: HAMP domain-containing protein [Kofleriaceae bacterium]|nr:HAMP domain-containing protein [Kofleriaceae bacterium]
MSRLAALGRLARWPVARIARMRLRTKLALSMSVAALLPMLVVASLASGVVLGNLEGGLERDGRRQLDVGLNLTLRSFERVGDDAVRLGSNHELAAAIPRGEAVVSEVLAQLAPHLPSSLVQVLDGEGRQVAARVIGGDGRRFAELAADVRSPVVPAALGWAARVTLEQAPTGVVVRAAAPVVDVALELTGVVVVSVPLDGAFADGIKGALGADVLVGSLNAGVVTSTTRDGLGARLAAIQVPARVLRDVRQRLQPAVGLDLDGREHHVTWTALVDDRGHALGLFAVALDRRPLLRAQRVAFRSLAVGAALALVFALALAGLLARRVGQPVAKLHRGAVAIARGDLDQAIDVAAGDEIGDLAVAFQHMTGALKENQQRLAARMREIMALHDAGRAMSSVIDLGQVSSKIVDSVARTFDVRLCALFLVPPGGGADDVRVSVAASRLRKTAAGMAPPPPGGRRRRAGADRGPGGAPARDPARRRRRRRRAPPRGRGRRRGRRRAHGGPARAQGGGGRRAGGGPRRRGAAVRRGRRQPARHLRRSGGGGDRERAALRAGPRRQRGAGGQGPAAHRRAHRDQPRARQGAGRPARDPGPARAVGAHGRPRPPGRRRGPRDQLAVGGDPGRGRRHHGRGRRHGRAGAGAGGVGRRRRAARGAVRGHRRHGPGAGRPPPADRRRGAPHRARAAGRARAGGGAGGGGAGAAPGRGRRRRGHGGRPGRALAGGAPGARLPHRAGQPAPQRPHHRQRDLAHPAHRRCAQDLLPPRRGTDARAGRRARGPGDDPHAVRLLAA